MVDLILDTGAAYNLISRDTALTLGFDLKSRRRSVPIVTANGIVRAPLVFLKRIAIGDAVATGVAAICHDIPEIVETSGLLGLSFLKNFRTVIDYRTLTLEIA
jgi:clan AA aspartic protease (TIGR02281 family)